MSFSVSCPYLQQVVGWEPIRGTDLTRPKKSTTEMTEQHHILFVKATQSTKLQNKKKPALKVFWLYGRGGIVSRGGMPPVQKTAPQVSLALLCSVLPLGWIMW